MGSFIDTSAILRELGLEYRLPGQVLALAEKFLGIRRLEQVCQRTGVTRQNVDIQAQIRDVLAGMGIAYDVSNRADFSSPQRLGPLIFYCNHPFGIADALIALRIALSSRPDTKVLANKVLGAFDINTDHLIWIDPFNGPLSNAANQRGLREALMHLRRGGALLMFPAGECSHLELGQRRITDSAWSQHLPRFLASTKAASVPIYFEGSNSWRFQVLGLLHPMLRTLLLLREFVGLRGQRIPVYVGAVSPHQPQDDAVEMQARTLTLRERVYALASNVERSQVVADRSAQ